MKKKKKKKVPVRAVCKVCGKKMYSLTTNRDGLITCPVCEKLDNDRQKMTTEMLSINKTTKSLCDGSDTLKITE